MPPKINDGLTNAQRYRQNHPEKVKWAVQGGKNEETKRRNQESALRHKYGENAVEYRERKRKEQNNCCGICYKVFVKTPHIDHDHNCCPRAKTCGKCLRGLLCSRCNMMLAAFENEKWKKKAIYYLQKWKLTKHETKADDSRVCSSR